MYKFAKLFEYPTGQLLITIDEKDDFDTDRCRITVRTDTADLSVSATYIQNSEQEARARFDSIDADEAQLKFTWMQKLMEKADSTESEVVNEEV